MAKTGMSPFANGLRDPLTTRATPKALKWPPPGGIATSFRRISTGPPTLSLWGFERGHSDKN